MRLLIIGASGLVGSALSNEASRRGHETLGTYFEHPQEGLKKLDYGDAGEVNKTLDSFLPDVILCPAGKTNVDWVEQNPKEAWKLNVSKLNVLFEVAFIRNIPLVFFSTDYIFDGKDGPYSEDDIPNPLNFYGQHKLVSEIMLKTYLPEQHLIVRVTWVFGQEKQGKNFVYSVIKNLSSGKEMKVPQDISATPVYVKDVARYTLDLVEKKYRGVYNISTGDCISKLEFAKSIAGVFGLDSSLIKVVKYNTMNLPTKRPLKAGFKNNKIDQLITPQWTPLMAALNETKLEMERVGQRIYELK